MSTPENEHEETTPATDEDAGVAQLLSDATEPPPEPITLERSGPAERLHGYDLARGLAFLGMVVVNYKIVLMGFRSGEPAWLSSFLDRFTSRAAPLFVMLAGVGLTLLYGAGVRRMAASDETPPWNRRWPVRRLTLASFLTGAALVVAYTLSQIGARGGMTFGDFLAALFAEDRTQLVELRARVAAAWAAFPTEDVRTYVWSVGGTIAALLAFWTWRGPRLGPRGVLFNRALFVLALGYAWHPIWSGDILHYYGAYLAIGALLVGRRARWCWLVLALIVVLTGWAQLRYDWSEGWTMTLEVADFWEPRGALRNLLFNGWHPLLPWLGLLVVGLLAGRLDGRKRGTAVLLMALGALLWIGVARGAEPLERALRWRGESSLLAGIDNGAVDVTPLAWTPDEDAEPVRRGARNRRLRPEIADAFEGDEYEAFVDAAETVGRIVGRVKGRFGYDEWVLRVDVAPERWASGGLPDVLLDVAYTTEVGVPKDHEPELRRLLATLALCMRGEEARKAGRIPGGTREWPDGITRLVVTRRVEVPDTEWGEWPSDEFVIGRDAARQASIWPLHLRRLTGTSSMPPGPLWFMSAAGSSLFVIGLSLLIASYTRLRRLAWPLVATGQLALTLYLAHVLFGLELLDALDLNRGQSLAFVTLSIVVCWIVSMAFACAWRAVFRRGPLEAAMRWMTG